MSTTPTSIPPGQADQPLGNDHLLAHQLLAAQVPPLITQVAELVAAPPGSVPFSFFWIKAPLASTLPSTWTTWVINISGVATSGAVETPPMLQIWSDLGGELPNQDISIIPIALSATSPPNTVSLGLTEIRWNPGSISLFFTGPSAPILAGNNTWLVMGIATNSTNIITNPGAPSSNGVETQTILS